MQRQAPGHDPLIIIHLLIVIMLYKDKLVGHNRQITPLKLVSIRLVKEQVMPLSVVLSIFYLSEMMLSKWRYERASASVVYLYL